MNNDRNERLAKAMGIICCDKWKPFHWDSWMKSPDECNHQNCVAAELYPPQFDRYHQKRDELLQWLAKDNVLWNRFLYCLMDILPKPEPDEDWRMYAKVFMTASPDQIAEAADRAIIEKENNKLL